MKNNNEPKRALLRHCPLHKSEVDGAANLKNLISEQMLSFSHNLRGTYTIALNNGIPTIFDTVGLVSPGITVNVSTNDTFTMRTLEGCM